MKFGLTLEQIKFVQELIVNPLRSQGATVYCYGSRARGDFKRFSDLDLMIESKTKGKLDLGEMHEKIQNSNFPYKIDLVQYSEFADAYKPSYQKDKVLFDESSS